MGKWVGGQYFIDYSFILTATNTVQYMENDEWPEGKDILKEKHFHNYLKMIRIMTLSAVNLHLKKISIQCVGSQKCYIIFM